MATRYNENFKIEVVKAYMAGDRSISEIAADYNVAKSTLTGWVKKHGEECQYKTTTKTSQEEFESAKEIRRLNQLLHVSLLLSEHILSTSLLSCEHNSSVLCRPLAFFLCGLNLAPSTLFFKPVL